MASFIWSQTRQPIGLQGMPSVVEIPAWVPCFSTTLKLPKHCIGCPSVKLQSLSETTFLQSKRNQIYARKKGSMNCSLQFFFYYLITFIDFILYLIIFVIIMIWQVIYCYNPFLFIQLQ